MKWDAELDALGLLCPLPVLKAGKRLAALEAGQVLRVESDDPASVIDFSHFCEQQGHRLVSHVSVGSVQVFLLRKGR